MKIKKRHIWTVLLLIYIAAVAYLCFMKPEGLPKVSPEFLGIPVDKVVHFLMFFPFTPMAYFSFKPKSRNMLPHFLVLLAVYAVGLSLAIGTEHVQGQLGYRSEDIHDFYADLVGISCSTAGTVIHILLNKNRDE